MKENRLTKKISTLVFGGRKEPSLTEDQILDHVRRQDLISFRSREQRYWSLRYDPNRQHFKGHYWGDY